MGDITAAGFDWTELFTEPDAVLGNGYRRILSNSRADRRTIRAMVSVLDILSIIPFARQDVAFAAALGWNTGTLGVIEDNRRPDVNETRNPLVEPICKKYMELRYSLLTYNYGLCREARDTGLGLIRALWLYYNNDPVAVVRGDEYMWGPSFLVAPVTEKGAVEKKVYLPRASG